MSCIAFGKWVNLGTRITLSAEPPAQRPNVCKLLDLPRFRALVEWRDATALRSALDSLASTGSLEIDGCRVHYGRINGREFKVEAPYLSITERHRGEAHVSLRPLRCFTIFLSAWGERIQALLDNSEDGLGSDTLDRELRSHSQPYDGLADLLAETFELPRPAYGTTPELSFVEIAAPIQVTLTEDCRLAGGSLFVQAEAAPGENINDASLGLIQWSGSQSLSRASYELAPGDWTRDVDRLVARKQIPAVGASRVIVQLRARGECLDKRIVRDLTLVPRNAQVAAYEHFDRGFARLKEFLAGSGSDPSKDFEAGVSILMSLCGFSVIPLGVTGKVQEEIDLLVFGPPRTRLLALECTLKDIDQRNKLSVLGRRSKELRETLQALYGDFDVSPLMVSTLSGEKIASSDRAKARTERIGIMAAEQLGELLEMAQSNEEPREIWSYLEALIPEPKFPFGRQGLEEDA